MIATMSSMEASVKCKDLENRRFREMGHSSDESLKLQLLLSDESSDEEEEMDGVDFPTKDSEGTGYLLSGEERTPINCVQSSNEISKSDTEQRLANLQHNADRSEFEPTLQPSVLLSRSLRPIRGADGLYRCGFPDCSVVRPHLWSINQHHNVHLRMFACKHCGSCCETAANLARHELSHSSMPLFNCTVCHRGFKDKVHLERHEKKATCQLKSLSPLKQPSEVKQRSVKVLKPAKDQSKSEKQSASAATIKCSACGGAFTTRLKLDRHQRHNQCELLPSSGSISPLSQTFICATCAFPFAKLTNLTRHLQTKACFAKKRKKSTSHKLGRKKLRDGVFQCQTCERRFTTNGHLERHLAKKTCETPRRERPKVEEPVPPSAPPAVEQPPAKRQKLDAYPCDWPGCTVVKQTASKLSSHRNIHLRKYECVICGKCWQDAFDLRKHTALCSGAKSASPQAKAKEAMIALDCDVCGETFQRASLLSAHKQTHEHVGDVTKRRVWRRYEWTPSAASNDGSTIVNLPPDSSDTLQSVSSSQLETLSDAGDDSASVAASCELPSFTNDDVCSTSTGRSSSSAISGRVYHCEWPGCSVTKKSGSQMGKHMNIHLRRFECKLCRFCYGDAYDLRKHMSNVHQNRTYECDVCGLDFVNRQELRAHAKTHKESFSDEDKAMADEIEMLVSTHPPKSSDPMSGDEQGPSNAKPAVFAHTAEGILRCDWPGCSAVRFSEQSLRQHRASHSGLHPVRSESSLTPPAVNRQTASVTPPACPSNAAATSPRVSASSAQQRTFACSICQLSFAQMAELREHNRRYHPASAQCPFTCQICALSLARFNDLMAHHRSHKQ